MLKNKKGLTVLELVVVIFIIAALMLILMIPGRAFINKVTARSRAAVDAANLRTVYLQIEKELIFDTSMNDITKNLSPIESEYAPGARILVNHSKNTSLLVYYVYDNHYYSLDYLTEVAVSGHSDLPTKKPFTLGFWYELGEGKLYEFIARKK